MALYVFTLCCFLASGLAILNLKGETGKMRRLALAIALACVLSGAARAGEIHTTGAAATPSTTTTGEIHGTSETETQASSTILTIIVTLFSTVR